MVTFNSFIKQAAFIGLLTVAACEAPEGAVEGDDFRSAPDITNTVTDSTTLASVTYEFWHFDDVYGAAFVDFTVNAWPRTGNGPVYLQDTYLDVTLEKDASGNWLATGTFTQPPQAEGAPCNDKQCSGGSCSAWAGGCNCFGYSEMFGACKHEWCPGGGGVYTPIELDVTFN